MVSPGRPLSLISGILAGALLLVSCGGPDPADPAPEATTAAPAPDVAAPAGAPLRAGERFLDLAMPEPYTPKAPTTGTDDYRCFLLDPGLEKSGFVTGLNVVPGQPDVVHHVILFRVPPDAVTDAEAADAAVPGEGWTCFGGAGMSAAGGNGDPVGALDRAPWLGAWAPGGGESILAPDVGIPLERGSRIIMQVHYNLLEGSAPDVSSARLRLAPGSADLDALRTMLLAGPVELPCRKGRPGKLCDRDAAVQDVTTRFGAGSGRTVAGLQLLCGGSFTDPKAGPVQTCDRRVTERATIRAVAGHMHLLGRSISITVNPGSKNERTLLDIPVWDFDDQGARSLKKPATIKPGDVLRVKCRHDQKLRDMVPELEGTPERYVVWGEGTTDEMCLGIVMLTKS